MLQCKQSPGMHFCIDVWCMHALHLQSKSWMPFCWKRKLNKDSLHTALWLAYSLPVHVTPLDVDSIWLLLQIGRVQLSTRITSIAIRLVVYTVSCKSFKEVLYFKETLYRSCCWLPVDSVDPTAQLRPSLTALLHLKSARQPPTASYQASQPPGQVSQKVYNWFSNRKDSCWSLGWHMVAEPLGVSCRMECGTVSYLFLA